MNYSTLLIGAAILVLSCTPAIAQDCETMANEWPAISDHFQATNTKVASVANTVNSNGKQFYTLMDEYNAANPSQRGALEPQLEQLYSSFTREWSHYIEVLDARLSATSAACQFMQRFQDAGCGEIIVDECRAELSERQQQRQLDAKTAAKVNNRTWRYHIEAEQTKPDEPKKPTVRVVNGTGMPICVHPGGFSAGACFDAGQSRLYKMDTLYGLDMDTNQRMPTHQLIVIGGGFWSGSPYTSYKDMTLCTERIFDHEDGEVEWVVRPGLEPNCGVRGYNQ